MELAIPTFSLGMECIPVAARTRGDPNASDRALSAGHVQSLWDGSRYLCFHCWPLWAKPTLASCPPENQVYAATASPATGVTSTEMPQRTRLHPDHRLHFTEIASGGLHRWGSTQFMYIAH